ncbi:MAG: serine/threonine-protein kinase [Chloroflexi bacterium]|nr:serine/threonine-protein kinase [Chloroflexota bacterium]
MIQIQDWIGQTLDQRYQITTWLRNSKTGVVFRAYDLVLGQSIAIELVDKTFSGELGFPVKFQQEIRKASRYRYPNLLYQRLAVHQPDTTSLCYVVIDLFDGYRLDTVLKALRNDTHWLTMADAIELVQQICYATEFIRRMGLLPRDLHPWSIWLTRTEIEQAFLYQPLLVDLGLTALLPPTAMPLQAPPAAWYQYLSPEEIPTAEEMPKAEGPTKPGDARSEVYQLGILLYELLMGRTPFPEVENLAQAQQKIAAIPPAPRVLVPDLPQPIEQVILTALAKAPLERFETAGAMAVALARILPVAQSLEFKVPTDNAAEGEAADGEAVPVGFGTGQTYIKLAKWMPTTAKWADEQLDTPAGRRPVIEPPRSPFTVKVDPPELRVKPGATVFGTISVAYTGTQTGSMWLEVQGPGREWCSLDSDAANARAIDVNGRFEIFRIAASPPAGPQSRAGVYPLRVDVKANFERVGSKAVAQITLKLIVEHTAGLLISDIWPQEIKPGEVAQVRIENSGNAPETVHFMLRGKSSDLQFEPTQVIAVIDAGNAETIQFAPIVRQPHLFGKDRLHDFAAEAVPQSTKNAKQLRGQVKVTHLISYWLIVLSALMLCCLLLLTLWLRSPLIGEANTYLDCPALRDMQPITVTQPNR